MTDSRPGMSERLERALRRCEECKHFLTAHQQRGGCRQAVLSKSGNVVKLCRCQAQRTAPAVGYSL